LIKPVEKNKIEYEIKELKDKIKIEGFENVAKNLSISKSGLNGGDLGWVSENEISIKLKRTIINTSIGELSEPIILSEGILFFKVRNKRMISNNLNLEGQKDQLIQSEKLKILNMHSLSHFDKIRRTVTINYFQ